jgi:hypothetical protein
MAYSQNDQFMSQSFSHTQSVSHDKSAENGYIEVTNVRSYKSASSNQFDPNDSPYGGLAKLTTFGPQWGMTASRGIELSESPYGNTEVAMFGSQYGISTSKGAGNIEKPYGKAEVFVYGPQYGVPALSTDDDLYDDSDAEPRNRRSIKGFTKVQVTEVSTEATATKATKSSLVDNAIPQTYTWEYDAASKKHDLVYKSSKKETKPKAVPETTLRAEFSPPLPEDLPKLEIHQGVPKSSWSSLSFRSNNDTMAETAVEEPLSQFTDSTELVSSWDLYGYSGEDMDAVLALKTGPRSCIICTDDFSATLKPPGWITISCTHEPSVCCGCMALCIKSDLESKIWNQITCPECKTLLVYEDIQRLADPETFAKYASSPTPIERNNHLLAI